MRIAPTVFFLCALGAVYPAGAAHAEEAADHSAGESNGDTYRDEWEFAVTPYLWVSSLDGDVTIRGVRAPAEAEFADIFELLDFAGIVHAEARRGKWGLALDVIYMNLTTDSDRRFIDIDVETELLILEFLGTYRFYEREFDGPIQRIRADAMVGGRYWSFDLDVEIEVPLLPVVRRDKSVDFVDLILGGRVFADITDEISVGASADVGGFDIGSSSDLTWSAMGIFTYHLRDDISLHAGYKHLQIERDRGSGTTRQGIDLAFSGPLLGATFRF